MRLIELSPFLATLLPSANAIGFWKGSVSMSEHYVEITTEQKTWFQITRWPDENPNFPKSPTVGIAIQLALSHMDWLKDQPMAYNPNRNTATVVTPVEISSGII